ncbi:DNA polymerase III subunit delta [Geitlerinema sp. P-1104]|uniref:DNA polymerase III subunit delta n=1 Tax=Geitlerinema sp. P-1104 TaxID=2546230 RepID=UPI001476C859|nr:DNA polymerase III subunit delta [Geitlerinema sp. P-1104]NMG59076.1 DNA polymerase III subunit delta [Geitlerinema sp. P-1104]
MAIYVYWGEDEFACDRAVERLRDRSLDPAWGSFNFDKIPADTPDATIEGLNQAMTPPFGGGQRFVWLENTPILQQCSQDIQKNLERTLPQLPDTSVLLLTTRKKPDQRLKSTKLFKKLAEFQEFSPIPPWKTELLIRRVREVARSLDISMSPAAAERLAETVGNNTRQLVTELEKLNLFVGNQQVGVQAVEELVTTTTQTSLQLAKTVLQGDTATALGLVDDLIARNEVPIVISATLIGQFRTWLWVKLMLELRERDEKAIAQAAEVGNPKRIYFLRQEVSRISLGQLQQTLPILLGLEAQLKSGGDAIATLQMKVIELCSVCRS